MTETETLLCLHPKPLLSNLLSDLHRQEVMSFLKSEHLTLGSSIIFLLGTKEASEHIVG